MSAREATVLPQPGHTTSLTASSSTPALGGGGDRPASQAGGKGKKKQPAKAAAASRSTVRRATKIAVVDGGRLVEEGTHDELLARPDSRYAHLCRLQGVAVPAANGHGDGAAESSALISL